MKVPVKAMTVLSVLTVLFGIAAPASPAVAGVSIGISVSATSLGIYQSTYPELVLVPGYPVYYAPHVPANYFFYDGQYWVYQDDQWYVSDWYNGPWQSVNPDDVPLFVLRVPVGYYLAPPPYFHGWALNAPPRWGYYWGPRWVRYRRGWDHWDRHVIPAPAPLPVYQRFYAGHRYPGVAHQRALHHQNYRYHRREAAAHPQRTQPRHAQGFVPPAVQGGSVAPRAQTPQRPHENVRRSGAALTAHKTEPPHTTPSQGNPPAARAQSPQRRHQSAQSPVPERTRQARRAPTVQTQHMQPRQQTQHPAQNVDRPQTRQRQSQARSESNSLRHQAGQHSGGARQGNHDRGGQGRR